MYTVYLHTYRLHLSGIYDKIYSYYVYIYFESEFYMKTAIIGSRALIVEALEKYLPKGTTEIVSGGAKGIDTCAKQFAIKQNIPFTEFLPQYSLYGRNAPLVRNALIAEYSDIIIAFWDQCSKGTAYTVKYAESIGKTVLVYIKNEQDSSSEFVLMK